MREIATCEYRPSSSFASTRPFSRSMTMFVSKTAFTSACPIRLAVSAESRSNRSSDVSTTRTLGDCLDLIFHGNVEEGTWRSLDALLRLWRRHVFSCSHPTPGSLHLAPSLSSSY